jgi:hypothetical protein
MKKKPICPHCRRSFPDLMVDPAESPKAICSGSLSRECLLWTAQHWAEQARFWKDLHDRQATLNCGLVNQNALLIQRNTRMEAILTEMGVDHPTRDTFEPPAAGRPKPVEEEERTR